MGVKIRMLQSKLNTSYLKSLKKYNILSFLSNFSQRRHRINKFRAIAL